MTILESSFKSLGPIALPMYQGRQMYMHTFDPQNPEMAPGYEDYLEPVMAMLKAAGVSPSVAHMTVDEKVVQPGMSQRRPGAHVDGCFMPEIWLWGHTEPRPPGPKPYWAHYCNNLPVERMSIIVASSVPGCIAYPGAFTGEPKKRRRPRAHPGPVRGAETTPCP